jgi:hypothetical protein
MLAIYRPGRHRYEVLPRGDFTAYLLNLRENLSVSPSTHIFSIELPKPSEYIVAF